MLGGRLRKSLQRLAGGIIGNFYTWTLEGLSGTPEFLRTSTFYIKNGGTGKN